MVCQELFQLSQLLGAVGGVPATYPAVLVDVFIVPWDTWKVKNFLQLFTARCPVSLPGALGVLLTVLIVPKSNRNVNRKFEKSFRKSDSCGIW